jgi:hypothetical protein
MAYKQIPIIISRFDLVLGTAGSIRHITINFFIFFLKIIKFLFSSNVKEALLAAIYHDGSRCPISRSWV